ncbi:MAG: hypothetical protein WC284_09190 [Candidimonas sp.]
MIVFRDRSIFVNGTEIKADIPGFPFSHRMSMTIHAYAAEQWGTMALNEVKNRLPLAGWLLDAFLDPDFYDSPFTAIANDGGVVAQDHRGLPKQFEFFNIDRPVWHGTHNIDFGLTGN